MKDLSKKAGVIAYAVVKSEDGSVVKMEGDSPFALDELVAFIGSGGEVIRDTLQIGNIDYLHLDFQGHKVIILSEDDNYVGLLCDTSVTPETILAPEEKVVEKVTEERKKEEEEEEEKVEPEEVEEEVEKPVEIPKPLQAKVRQINSIFIEFSSEGEKEQWIGLLKKGVKLLSQELADLIKVSENGIEFVTVPTGGQVEECSSALRSVVDFLVKKAVEEFGPSKARMKVQRVIENLKK